MKLSVSAFQAQASAQRKILSSCQNQLNYGACTSSPSFGGYALDEKKEMMVDSTDITSTDASHGGEQTHCFGNREPPSKEPNIIKMEMDQQAAGALLCPPKREQIAFLDRIPIRTRSKSNQRWMKLRTTVQLSSAISGTNQKQKTPLKREDSFLKRFSTRQIPETQETVDTGDETETHNNSQTQIEVNRRRRKRRREMSRTVVNPDENFYFYWLMTVTVCVLYNLWTLIVRQSFPELQRAASAFWFSGDGFTDIVFVCDIMVQLRTGYLEQGLMVYNSKKLASHYVKSRAFILDTLSLVPLDFLQLNIGINPLLRFPRFLKVYRVYNYYYMVESRTVYPNLWRVVNLIHILLILAHWFGCFYYLLSEAEGFQGDWVYPHHPGDYATLTRKYLGSLYWSTLTLTTIGDLPTPETNAESRGRSKAMTSSGQSEGIPRRGHKSRLLQFNSNYGYLFTIVSYLIGVFIFATIVGQVGNVITNRNANRLEFERLLDGAKTYMRHHKVPGGMKRRVLRWYDYSWSRGRIQGGGDINTALGLLPDKLKTELALHVNLSVLKKVTIFQECQPEFLHDLVLKMKAYIFTPGDLICRKGEVAREMFIIADGILDVISETGRVLTTMKAGDFFGEIGILNLDGLNKRTADVRSVGYSELFSLSREDVLAAMKDYPEAQDILQSLGRKRLMEAKNASKMHKAQARPAKDHDSSGDSDAAGRNIVEKLRSDVKGLKKVLRRSRRGTRAKVLTDGEADARGKKQNTLRRMSHVQSSDECEAGVDPDPTPIGAGLPLLQRLKILQEKQEREREEKESLKKSCAFNRCSTKRGESDSSEKTSSGSPFSKLFKQRELKEPTKSGFGTALSTPTVRTQITGTQLSSSSAKTRTVAFRKDPGKVTEVTIIGEKNPAEQKEKIGMEMRRFLVKERPKIIHGEQVKEKNSLPRSVPENETMEGQISKSVSERDRKPSLRVPLIKEGDSSVLVCKDGWKLLKKFSISCPRLERRIDEGKEKVAKKVSKAGIYLSKSDTVLERQATVQCVEEKRSRSTSPQRSHNVTGGESMGERKKSRSVDCSPKLEELRRGLGHCQTLNSSREETPKTLSTQSEDQSSRKMKKYNSISDLSPEYSRLPFVKKLKILNERQKLEELEKELVVRSVSLDVSEQAAKQQGHVLVRSRSEASAGEYVPSVQRYSDCRNPSSDKKCESFTVKFSEGSIPSPEGNETLERRRLKSILKKLSAEGSTCDEDKVSRTFKRVSSRSTRHDISEFRKLMREPTVEGYVARHKKLTKSVTFDNETLPSPLEAALDPPSDDPKVRGFTPMSPTAILTLQLTNLSMMPISSPKKLNISEVHGHEGKVENRSQEARTTVTGMTVLKENERSSQVPGRHEHMLWPSSSQPFKERKTATFPLNTSQQEHFFQDVEQDISFIVRQILEKAHNKLDTQFNCLKEEIRKREEIISHLQSKIQDLEKFNSGETVKSVCPPSLKGALYLSAPAGGCSEKLNHLPKTTEDELLLPVQGSNITLDKQLFADALRKEETMKETESVDGDVKENSGIGPNWLETSSFLKRSSGKCSEALSDEEMELVMLGNLFRAKDPGELQSNGSADESHEEAMSEAGKLGKITGEGRDKGSFMNRMTGFQRSVNSYQAKTSDFVALEIDDSSNSSDLENGHNKDWEVEMLIEQLPKNDPYWNPRREYWESPSETKADHLEDVVNLQEEVNTLKRMVCDSDLSRLTSSELDILESIVEAKDQKIIQIAKSNSLDNGNKSDERNSSKRTACSSPARTGNEFKESARLKKPSLKHKVGLALSFDFHDMQSQRPKIFKTLKPKHSRCKTFSALHRGQRSFYHFWCTPARLRNRVLDDSSKLVQNLIISDSSEASSRSSLPTLVPTSSDYEKTSCFRTSLPLLSAYNFRSPRGESFCKPSAIFRPQVDSFQNPPSDSDHCEAEAPATPETLASTSLNSFIRSVGQKVKKVMAGDAKTIHKQVPTISRLLESTPKSSTGALPKSTSDLIREPYHDSARSIVCEAPETLRPSETDPKVDPADH